MVKRKDLPCKFILNVIGITTLSSKKNTICNLRLLQNSCYSLLCLGKIGYIIERILVLELCLQTVIRIFIMKVHEYFKYIPWGSAIQGF